MEGFDAIYYEDDEEISGDVGVTMVRDPVIIRGAGNMTVYVIQHLNRCVCV